MTAIAVMPASAGLVKAAVRCLGWPMPTADLDRVRTSARRYGAYAAELRRTGAVLTGPGGPARWDGVAATAFSATLAAQARTLPTAAQRFDDYASALARYAATTEELTPRLRNARAELATARTGTTSMGADARPGADAGPDSDQLHALITTFTDTWNQWDAAARRCRHELTTAGHGDHDTHGWAAFTHHLTHTLHAITDPLVDLAEHPSLSTLSTALGDLAGDLTLLGLALLVVFPPAAGICFTAAAVMSIAKLATDSTRAATGDHTITPTTLIEDAAAATPLGKLTRETTAARTLEGLLPEERVTRLVPGGGLAQHEGGAIGGHTLAKHVAKPIRYLKKRLARNPDLSLASTFRNRAEAEAHISALLADDQADITKWLERSGSRYVAKSRFSVSTGVTLGRGAHLTEDVFGIKAILRRDPTMSVGYRIETAYPEP